MPCGRFGGACAPFAPLLGSGTENGYMTILHAISLVYYLKVGSWSFKCIITSYSAIAAMPTQYFRYWSLYGYTL